MAEFALVAIPVLFLGLGGVEISHWLFTRQAVSLALLEAGRAAITDHNRPERIIHSFESALRPLYTTNAAGGAPQRLAQALASRQQRMQAAPWQIEVLSPSASAYADFADMALRVHGTGHRAAINNNYLSEQHQRHRSRGWIEGRGPVSGQTVFEANTLVLRLSWLHQPRLPLMAPLLRALGDPAGSYRQRALAHAYVPMTRQITLLMQSHPVQWANDPKGKVLFHAENVDTGSVCRGWLCHSSGTGDTLKTNPSVQAPVQPAQPDGGGRSPEPGSSDSRDPPPPGGSGVESPTQPAGPPVPASPDYGDLVVDPDDPACGVTLCCV